MKKTEGFSSNNTFLKVFSFDFKPEAFTPRKRIFLRMFLAPFLLPLLVLLFIFFLYLGFKDIFLASVFISGFCSLEPLEKPNSYF